MVKFLNSPERPEQGELSSFINLLLHPLSVWALDLPRIHPIKVTRGLVCIKQPMIYTALCIMFLGPKWHSPIGSMTFHRAQKLENSRAQLLPTSPSNGYARIQNIMHRAVYNRRCINSYIRVYSLKIQSVMLVFSTQICEMYIFSSVAVYF